MKKSELKKIQKEYFLLRSKLNFKEKLQKDEIQDKLKELEHEYFHETGREINSNS